MKDLIDTLKISYISNSEFKLSITVEDVELSTTSENMELLNVLLNHVESEEFETLEDAKEHATILICDAHKWSYEVEETCSECCGTGEIEGAITCSRSLSQGCCGGCFNYYECEECSGTGKVLVTKEI